MTYATTQQRQRAAFAAARIPCPKCSAGRGFAPVVDHSQPNGYDATRGYCHACGATIGFRKSEELPAEARADILARWYAMTMRADLSLRNGLAAYMAQRFGAAVVQDHLQRHHVGTDGIGNAVYWYVNGDGEAVTCKAVPYDPMTAKRRKGTDSPICWPEGRTSETRGQLRHVDSIHGICTGNNADGTASLVSLSHSRGYGRPCLYGEWQLSDEARRNDTVLLVEAEKTAVVASLFLPELVVVATGGTSGLTADKAQALVGRTVLVLMDNDASGERSIQNVARALYDAGALPIVEVDGQSLAEAFMPADAPKGYDLADYYLHGEIEPPAPRQQHEEPEGTAPASTTPADGTEDQRGDAWEPPVDTPAPPRAAQPLETPQTDHGILSAILRAYEGETVVECGELQRRLVAHGYNAAVYSMASLRGMIKTTHNKQRGAWLATLVKGAVR